MVRLSGDNGMFVSALWPNPLQGTQHAIAYLIFCEAQIRKRI